MAIHDQCWKTAESLSAQLLYAKRQLAEALQALNNQRVAIRADVIEQAKAEARKQAFEDAIAVLDALYNKRAINMDTLHECVMALRQDEALRRERDK